MALSVTCSASLTATKFWVPPVQPAAMTPNVWLLSSPKKPRISKWVITKPATMVAADNQTQQYRFNAKFFQFRETEFERHQKQHHRNHQIPGRFSGCPDRFGELPDAEGIAKHRAEHDQHNGREPGKQPDSESPFHRQQ